MYSFFLALITIGINLSHSSITSLEYCSEIQKLVSINLLVAWRTRSRSVNMTNLTTRGRILPFLGAPTLWERCISSVSTIFKFSEINVSSFCSQFLLLFPLYCRTLHCLSCHGTVRLCYVNSNYSEETCVHIGPAEILNNRSLGKERKNNPQEIYNHNLWYIDMLLEL